MKLEKAACMHEVHGTGLSRLYLQDVQSCMPLLINDYCGKVQLIYIDPPFFTGKDYYHSGFSKQGDADSLQDYSDKWGSREELLSLLEKVLAGCRQLLAPEGSIYVHIDYRLGPHVRLMMDNIFGEKNFLNEIIWHYKSGGTAKKYFPRKHDTILFYRKSNQCYFNITPLGVSRGRERRNHLKHNVDIDGRVYWSIRSAGKEYRYYEDSPVYPSDVWDDIPHLQQKDGERTGYATQKPEKLLERIILASSRPGDYVCDLFCGSGTTLVVANDNKRKFIGVDNSPIAFSVTRSRLLGADMALQLEESIGNPSIKLNVSFHDGLAEILLCGYSDTGEQENRRKPRQLSLMETRLGEEVSCGDASDNDTASEYFAVGEIQGGTFYVKDSTCWRKGGRLAMPVSPHMGVTVGDITGKQYFFRLFTGD
ncbi:MAG: DNA-methyltransferase [Christensenellales bacterium]